MGAVDQTLNQMGYGGDMMNALKILSSDQSKKIMQAVAMMQAQSKPLDATDIQPYTSNQTPITPDVIQMAAQSGGLKMEDPQAAVLNQPGLTPYNPVAPNTNTFPTPTPSPTPRSGYAFDPNKPHADLIIKYFPREQWGNAQKVMEGESGYRATAHNGNAKTGDDSWGLYQINRYGNLAKERPSSEKLVDPEFNVKYAAEMYKKQGWGPWGAARRAGIK